MTQQQLQSRTRKPIRLWPGIAAAVLFVLIRFVLPIVQPDSMFYAGIGGLACALAIVIWWLFLSRAPWLERAGAIVLMAVSIYATSPIVHVSIRTGMMGMMYPIYAITVLPLALVAGAVIGRRGSAGFRRASIVAAILLLCGTFTALRTDGIGSGGSELAWRWSSTPEERLLVSESAVTEAPVEAIASTSNTDADWPGFRGPHRDGIVRGTRIETDWTKSPPVEMWHRAIGPGWSSFAVSGDLLYTQEQRGDDEIVACHRVTTGEPVWQHRDAVRFWESNAGAGPRGTPTLSGGRIYALGATGVLNALDAGDGKVVWSRDLAADSNTKVPIWGFSSSPLVVDDLVLVAAGGKLAGYDLATGRPSWLGPAYGGGYSSPHRATIDGVTQVLMLSGKGATGVAPADGTVLWQHEWPGVPIMQPALTADGDILISAASGASGLGIRRLAIAHGSDGWKAEERWTSMGLKPYFNDFVVHKGHAYGFDGSILACIDLQDGERKWKGGRYGNGQLVLLPDQDLLLVLSEDGELALVGATTDQYRELARFPALKGKTWNHPALVRDVLLVRNGQEMAAFRLPVTGG
ncbi:MAG: PQQ-binding-like beta-propeller repeat protein [Candidatus Polarisedimenticolia bacterium]